VRVVVRDDEHFLIAATRHVQAVAMPELAGREGRVVDDDAARLRKRRIAAECATLLHVVVAADPAREAGEHAVQMRDVELPVAERIDRRGVVQRTAVHAGLVFHDEATAQPDRHETRAGQFDIGDDELGVAGVEACLIAEQVGAQCTDGFGRFHDRAVLGRDRDVLRLCNTRRGHRDTRCNDVQE
jgi:hypothetical protein